LITISRLLSERDCELDLPPRWRGYLFLLAVVIPALWLGYWTTRWFYAGSLASADVFLRVQRAAALDPGNPQIREKLGLIRLFAADEAHPADAVEYFREAIGLAPRRTAYRVDLATACDWNKDLDCSDAALDRALQLSPMAPRLEWITANHYVRTQRSAMAVAHLHRLLELDTNYARPVFALCTRVFGDPDFILTHILPARHEPTLKLNYIDFLGQQGQFNFADHIWSDVAASGAKFPFQQVQPYFERLLSAGRISQAAHVWNDLKRLQIITTPKSESADDLVFNGSFEQAPLKAGFGWQSSEIPYVTTDFQDPSGVKGTRCLRVDFTVPRNDEVEVAFQLIPVHADTTYRLSARVRSQDISSDSGPRLRVEDPACPGCLDVQTEGTVGTSPWHALNLQFTTGDHTNLIRLSVSRLRSRTFPPSISGSFWLDDVSIREATRTGSGPDEP
jgi:tetratricopeptide (TPR) repeat protein